MDTTRIDRIRNGIQKAEEIGALSFEQSGYMSYLLKVIDRYQDLEGAVFSMLMVAADEASTDEDAAHAVLSVNMAYQKLVEGETIG